MDVILKPGQSIKPIIHKNEAKILVECLYGIKCKSIISLDGYDDKNYRITVDQIIDNEHMTCIYEEGYVLKILNSLDSEKVDLIEAQNKLLLHLRKKNISCPEPIPTKHGKCYTIESLTSGKHIVRLMKFISGTILCKVPTNNFLFYQIGQYVAGLDEEMKDFNSDAYKKQKTLWMLESISELRKFLFAVNSQARVETVSKIIDKFEKTVLNDVNNLEKGLIHGDFNEQNVLVEKEDDEWRFKAILDFGDSQYSCYLFELAVTLAYMLILGKDLEVGGHIIAGYHKTRSIPRKEFEVLKVCVEARICQSLVLGAYSSQQDPDNNYILSTAKPGWELLNKLSSMSDQEVLKIWASTASNYCKDFELDYIANNR